MALERLFGRRIGELVVELKDYLPDTEDDPQADLGGAFCKGSDPERPPSGGARRPTQRPAGRPTSKPMGLLRRITVQTYP